MAFIVGVVAALATAIAIARVESNRFPPVPVGEYEPSEWGTPRPSPTLQPVVQFETDQAVASDDMPASGVPGVLGVEPEESEGTEAGEETQETRPQIGAPTEADSDSNDDDQPEVRRDGQFVDGEPAPGTFSL